MILEREKIGCLFMDKKVDVLGLSEKREARKRLGKKLNITCCEDKGRVVVIIDMKTTVGIEK